MTFCMLVPFVMIVTLTPIDPLAYMKEGIPVISHYDEAMYSPVNPSNVPYKTAMYLLTATGVLVAAYTVRTLRQKSFNAGTLYTILTICLACFLFYKNGFTRGDNVHYNQFYATFPLFFIFTALALKFNSSRIALATGTAVSILSLLCHTSTNNDRYHLGLYDLEFRLNMSDYYLPIFQKPQISGESLPELPMYMRKAIGQSTVDLIPHDVSLLLAAGLNYNPRPIFQSYSAYSGYLDKLNANHFLKTNRPDFVLIQNDGVDNRYHFWDESFTKATIELNYNRRKDTTSRKEEWLNNDTSYLMLQAVPGKGAVPEFRETDEITCKTGEQVPVPEDTLYPVYMSVDIEYTPLGFINKMIFQPTEINICFITTKGDYSEYRLVRPIAREPVPVGYLVTNNEELANFYDGKFNLNPKVSRVIFKTANKEIKQPLSVKFYRFENYRREL